MWELAGVVPAWPTPFKGEEAKCVVVRKQLRSAHAILKQFCSRLNYYKDTNSVLALAQNRTLVST